MTNLQSLSIFLTERLMMAAQDIYKAVEVTVSEYHDEISRCRHESELLRRKLLEAGIEFYPEVQPGPSVLPAESCIGSDGLISDEELQVKQELSAAKQNPDLPPPQETMPEEPGPPNPCLEADRGMENMFQTQSPESSVNLLLEAQPCMQIKEELRESKSDLETEIFCQSQTSVSVNPSSAGLEIELDRLSSMHKDPELPIPTRVAAGQPDRDDHYDPLNQNKEQIQRRERRACGMNKLPKPGRERTENLRACRKKDRIPEVMLMDEEQSLPMFQEGMKDKDLQLSCDPSSAYPNHPDGTQCVVCGRGFASRGLLKIHLRVHSGERPYHCPYCNKNFRQSSHLNVHVRIHTGEKPYTCLTCGKRYSDRSACNRHVKAHLENQ
ncbi:zinc finger protein 75A [Trichomycterus rosablanca]|uniref:zinc finger protein 75A n=1 Tax=Trichomycterus rosablanca TaxID=2290929 RepID=UPI002F34F25A